MIKQLRLAGAVATLALSALVVAVAPVGAGTTGATATFDCSVLDGLASLTGGEALGRDDGGRREPSLDEPVNKLGDVGLTRSRASARRSRSTSTSSHRARARPPT